MKRSHLAEQKGEESNDSSSNGIVRNFIGLSRTEQADKYLQKLQKEREAYAGKYKQELEKLPMRINQLHTVGDLQKRSNPRKKRDPNRINNTLWKDKYDVGEIGMLVKKSLDISHFPHSSIEERILNVTNSLLNVQKYNELQHSGKEQKLLRSLGELDRKKADISVSSLNNVKARKFIPNEKYSKLNGESFHSCGGRIEGGNESHQVINLDVLKRRKAEETRAFSHRNVSKSYKFLSHSLSDRSYNRVSDWSNDPSALKLAPDFHTSKLKLPVFLPPLSVRMKEKEKYDSQLGVIKAVQNSNRVSGLRSASSTSSARTAENRENSFLAGFKKVLQKVSSAKSTRIDYAVKPSCKENKPLKPRTQRKIAKDLKSPKEGDSDFSKGMWVVEKSSRQKNTRGGNRKNSLTSSQDTESYESDFSDDSYVQDTIKVEIKPKQKVSKHDSPCKKMSNSNLKHDHKDTGDTVKEHKTVPFRRMSIEF